MITDVLIADDRAHNPLPAGWVPGVNSAPLWWKVGVADSVGGYGATCSGSVVANIAVEAGRYGCTRLTLITTWDYLPDKTSTAIVTDRHIELKAPVQWAGSVANEVYFKVERICGGTDPIAFRLEERITERSD
ncbi:MAG: hypothetical protein U0075_03965 [Thermomicrobiales bacterium]